MSDSERLIKQTYSVHVSLPADNARGISRKWHISMFLIDATGHLELMYFDIAAYFSQEKLNTLNTIDNIGGVGDILVPEGLFRSGRAAKSRVRETDSTRAPSGEEASTTDNTHSSGNFVQDPPSFSAFHSTPPDAAIRKPYSHPIYKRNTASSEPRYRISVPNSWKLSPIRVPDYEKQNCH